MCVAIFCSKGSTVTAADLALAHASNDDGCGFAVRSRGKVHIEKGLWTFAEFWERFAPHLGKEAAVHFRLASAGTISTANCHPFAVGTGALIHNGHLEGYGTKTHSDTAQWCETVFKPLLAKYPHALRDPLLRRLVENSLGRSKMVYLPAQGEATILNETQGVWEGGVWYSQTAYRMPWKATTRTRSDDWRTWLNASSDTPDLGEDPEEEWCEHCYSEPALYGVCRPCLDVLDSQGLGSYHSWHHPA